MQRPNFNAQGCMKMQSGLHQDPRTALHPALMKLPTLRRFCPNFRCERQILGFYAIRYPLHLGLPKLHRVTQNMLFRCGVCIFVDCFDIFGFRIYLFPILDTACASSSGRLPLYVLCSTAGTSSSTSFFLFHSRSRALFISVDQSSQPLTKGLIKRNPNSFTKPKRCFLSGFEQGQDAGTLYLVVCGV